MQLLKQKKEIEIDRDTLIQHLEQKLAYLKAKRDQYQQGQSANTKFQNVHPKIQNNHEISDHLRQKQDQQRVKEKLSELQKIYNKKKQLRQIGIIQNNLSKINQLHKNPKIQNKIKSHNPKQKQIKNKILQQQMEKIEKIINKKKATKKQLKQIQEMNFKLLTQKIPEKDHQKLKYYQLIKKSFKNNNALTNTQKQELVQIVFSFLKQGGLISKKKTRQFLLANQDFCKIFYLSNQQIYRDLQVYQTNEEKFLNQREFYEFLKSIQISNLMLKPNLKKKQIKVEQTLKKQKNQQKQNHKQQNLKQQQKKEMKMYLKKIFEYFDTKKQRIVQRQKFQIALKKCLLFDIKLYKHMKKETVVSFSQYLQKQRAIKNKKSYYMQLQGKYIGLQQIQQVYSNFNNKVQIIQDSTETQQSQNLQQQNQLKTEQQQQMSYIPQKVSKGNLQQYFKMYGWSNHKGNQISQQSELTQLKKLDKYYKQLRNKHGNQIQWQNFVPQYKQDFGKLQAYIKSFEQKTNKNK